MDEADRCDRLLLMRDGSILATGTPARPPGRHRRGRPRRRVPARSSSARRPAGEARCDARDRRPGAAPAPPRPAHRRPPARRPVPARDPAQVRARRAARRHSTASAAPLLGLFPFITMFLVTSITMLRERTTGTLERLMAMPIAKLDLLLGYGLAFGAGRGRPGGAHDDRRASGSSTSRRRARRPTSWSSPSPTPCSGCRSACS